MRATSSSYINMYQQKNSMDICVWCNQTDNHRCLMMRMGKIGIRWVSNIVTSNRKYCFVFISCKKKKNTEWYWKKWLRNVTTFCVGRDLKIADEQSNTCMTNKKDRSLLQDGVRVFLETITQSYHMIISAHVYLLGY